VSILSGQDQLDRDKIIVTMCPHYDRAEIARLYLTLKGYRSCYFNAGMLKLVDYLRGDKARDYMASIK
jgi:rhodanese-related sulfurtransferase